jgi:hypothetical protein
MAEVQSGLPEIPVPAPSGYPTPAADEAEAGCAVTVAVRIPIRTVAGLNQREHWAAKAKRVKAERTATAWAMSCTIAPALPCVVVITREGKGTMDGDNLQSAGKAVRDAVADWLGVNDNDPRIDWIYRQRKAKDYAVLVEIGPQFQTLANQPLSSPREAIRKP